MTMNLLEELRTITEASEPTGKKVQDVTEAYVKALVKGGVKTGDITVDDRGDKSTISGTRAGKKFVITVEMKDNGEVLCVGKVELDGKLNMRFSGRTDTYKALMNRVQADVIAIESVARFPKEGYATKPWPGERTEAADPWDEAAKLIKQGAEGGLNKMIQTRLDGLLTSFKDAQKQMEGLRKYGAGNTESTTLLLPVVRKLRDLAKFIDGAADHAVKVGELKEATKAKCPGCGAMVEPDEDDECPECGADMDEDDSEDATCEACGCKSKKKKRMAEGATCEACGGKLKKKKRMAEGDKAKCPGCGKMVEPDDDECPECGEDMEPDEDDMTEGATPGARSKGTGFGKGETAAAGEFWDKGPTGKKSDKEAFNKAQRSGKKKHIDAQMRGEGLSGELESILAEGKASSDPMKGPGGKALKTLEMLLADAKEGGTLDPANLPKEVASYLKQFVSLGATIAGKVLTPNKDGTFRVNIARGGAYTG